MKLFYFNLEAGIVEIGPKEEPEIIREITEHHIKEAGYNSSDHEWLALIGVAYSEAFAQWFDSLGPKTMKTLSKDCDRYIITDQREIGNLIEKQVTSAFNIIGVSIHRAMQSTEFAIQKRTQGTEKVQTLRVTHGFPEVRKKTKLH